MIQGLIGKKVGMTQIFREDGTVVPVTVVKAGPCLVVQKKTAAKDGYDAIQLGLVEERAPRNVTKALKGHFDRASVAPMRELAEFRIAEGDDIKPGDKVLADTFAENEHVDVEGWSKGKGFAGVVRRHHFAGGRATHGSMFHRAPGSIGASSDPSRVWPGHPLPGRMGGDRRTVLNLPVVRVVAEQNLILLRGAVPGARGGVVLVRKSVKQTKAQQQKQGEK
jgi:large subunit ribosomal protein L3